MIRLEQKIKTQEEIFAIAKNAKRDGKKVVFCNGSFDIMHAGHVYFLIEARKQGDILIVGLNSDKSVREWKKLSGSHDWEKRPINNQRDRAYMLAALTMVDYVCFFEETSPLILLEGIKCDVFVNGTGYPPEHIQREIDLAQKHGARTVIIERIQGLSTSELVKKIIDAYST